VFRGLRGSTARGIAPVNITVTIDDREFRAAFAQLGPRTYGALAKGLNRVAFEMRDAEIAESKRSFELRRLRPNFRFDPATAGKTEVVFMPLPLSEKFVKQHVHGGRVTPDEGPERLEVRGEFAVPIGILKGAIKRGGSGRIPSRKTPAFLLSDKGRGFIARGPKRALIIERKGRGKRSDTEALYALVPSVQLTKRFKFYETAHKAAQQHFATKAREEFAKAITRGTT
jgi:hypothetical protein